MGFAADQFTDSDGVLLSAHVDPAGYTWTQNPASTATMSIVSNRAKCDGAYAKYTVKEGPISADYEVIADVKVNTTLASVIVGVMARCDSSADTNYVLRLFTDINTWDLIKWVAGSATQLATGSVTLSAGNTYRLRLRCFGSQISAYIDNIPKAFVTDTAISAAGYPGIYGQVNSSSSTGANIDNFFAQYPFVKDTITDSDGVALTSHTGEIGATWSAHPTGSGTATIDSNRVHQDNVGGNQWKATASGSPAAAAYVLEADLFVQTYLAGTFAGICARHDPTADTKYFIRHDKDNNQWELYQVVAGAYSLLTTNAHTLSSNATYHIYMYLNGTSIKVFRDTTSIFNSTDSGVSAAGLVGMMLQDKASSSTGYHFDNFWASDSPGIAGDAPPSINQSYNTSGLPGRVTQEFLEVSWASGAPSNNVRTTQEFLEVSWRNPLVAEPPRVTQEFLEVSYHSAPPSNAIRLTQQTVEVLYLERPATPVPFDDCGNFTGIREWEARVYDSAGKRKSLGGALSVNTDGCITSFADPMSFIDTMEFEINERGGCGSGSMQLMAEWQNIGFDGTEYVDVYLLDSTAPVYRGFLQIAQKEIGETQRASPTLYGLANRLNFVTVTKKYAYGSPLDEAYGCAVDLSTLFRDLVTDHVLPIFPTLVIQTETIGVTTKEFDARGKSVFQALNDIADLSPDSMIWGGDVTSTLLNRLYLRRRATETRYGFAVGANVQAFVYPVDTGSIVNKLNPFKGGKVKQPNLLGNGSFEEGEGASDAVGNLLLNNGFEDDPNTAWSLGGGASIKKVGDAGADGGARGGNHWLELDTDGETAIQTVKIDYRKTYTAFGWIRREDVAAYPTALEVELLDSGSSIVATLTSGDYAAPASNVYELRSYDADPTAYPTATQMRVRWIVNSGPGGSGGTLIDDAGVVEACSVGQAGWRSNPGVSGDTWASILDWAHKGVSAFHGGYCLKIQASGSDVASNPLDIYTPKASYVATQVGERFTVSVRYRTDGVSAPSFKIGVQYINGDGTVDSEVLSDAFGGTSTDWRLATFLVHPENSVASIMVFFRILNTNILYLDAAGVVKGEIPDEWLNHSGYWPGDGYERTIRADDSDLTGLDSGVATSITTYGVRDKTASNDKVLERLQCLDFSAGYFNAHAVPLIQGHLTLKGIRRTIGLDGKVKVVGLPNAPAALVPARVRYSIGENIYAQVELGNEYPELAQLLKDVAAT